MNIFHSARLKLTAFYFAVLLAFCLLLTFGIREFATHEFGLSNDAQRLSAHNLIVRLYAPTTRPIDDDFAAAQDKQVALARDRLNRDIVLIDLTVLVLGAVMSYWFAGWTLKPIEEAHEEQKRFTADASHELRTPLTSLRLENEVFLRQKRFNEADARVQLNSNLEEVSRLETLANSLLALNQYETASLVRKPVQVRNIVTAATDYTEKVAASKQTRFKVTVADSNVLGDKESLVELLCILLDNAVKYGPEKGTVAITGEAQDGHYLLSVRDEGLGITEEDLPHIFERLYRGDKARSGKVSGYGIGLSLAEKIAAANEVTIEATNHPDGGALFTLRLETGR